MTCRSGISFVLNGEEVTLDNPDPEMLLSEYIRIEAGLKGTKISCAQGGCGACTVLLASLNPPDGEALSYRPINSCLRPLMATDGYSVKTVEAIGSSKTGLHDVQKQIVKHNGSQCGFCTPGFVTSMYGLLQSNPAPTAQEVEDHFDGNLCRCTGYRPILDAFQALICHKTGQPCPGRAATLDIEELSLSACTSACPARPGLTDVTVSSGSGVAWMKLHALEDLYALLRLHPAEGAVRLVAGNTSVGVYAPPPAAILADVSQLAELRGAQATSQGLTVGAATTITDFVALLEAHASVSPSTFSPLAKFLKARVANQQVRNMGTVVGNLMVAHAHPAFVSDVATALAGAGATLTLAHAASSTDKRQVALLDFFQLSRQGLVVEALHVPAARSAARLLLFKIGARRVNAHSFVNAAFQLEVDPTTCAVTGAPVVVYGGVQLGGPHRAPTTEAYLSGKCITDAQVMEGALQRVREELLPVDAALGRAEYRTALVSAFLYKALLHLWPAAQLPPQLQSAVTDYVRPVSTGQVSFDTDPTEYPVSRPLHKNSLPLQATGEALYVDDVDYAQQLHAQLVLTTRANAAIDSIDASKALLAPGVRRFVGAKDIMKAGYCNSITEHEDVFTHARSSYYGQALGVIIADSKKHAEAAAKLVEVAYSDEQAPILTIADAVAANSFFEDSKRDLHIGSANAINDAEVVIEGEVGVGHQYHFHMETQRAVCVPGEDGGMAVHSSTQHPSLVQQVVATALGVAQHKVTVSVKRVGGAFGSKINRCVPVAMACALAADIVRKPVRLILSLDTNMQNVGGRSPYLCKYKVGATRAGKITAFHLRVFNNHGAHYDIDYPDMSTFLYFLDNVYKVPNWDVELICARTNLPACTYMRGPGYVESVFIMESMVEHVATALGLPPDQVRAANLYGEGDTSIMGQRLTNCNARLVYDTIKASSEYEERAKSVAAFNEGSRWVKRGLSLVLSKYGFAWADMQFMALVSIYPDGSVKILQTGCELGQGLEIRVTQVAAYTLGQVAEGGCPLDEIRLGATSTDVSIHGDCTGGSTTSELCAMAVQQACRLLVDRLKPVAALAAAARNGQRLAWAQLISSAVTAGVDLQARGRVHQGPSPDGDFQYMSYGASVTEAEVDILTGDTRLLRCDLLLDCGKSLNPAVDIGQVQGAYVMGLGYFLTEEFTYDNTSGQAAGEPPYGLANSAILAVRQAVAAGRAQQGDDTWLPLSAPATVEKVAAAAGVTSNLLKV
eukprot:jgi/Mesen1/846/ME000112S10986